MRALKIAWPMLALTSALVLSQSAAGARQSHRAVIDVKKLLVLEADLQRNHLPTPSISTRARFYESVVWGKRIIIQGVYARLGPDVPQPVYYRSGKRVALKPGLFILRKGDNFITPLPNVPYRDNYFVMILIDPITYKVIRMGRL